MVLTLINEFRNDKHELDKLKKVLSGEAYILYKNLINKKTGKRLHIVADTRTLYELTLYGLVMVTPDTISVGTIEHPVYNLTLKENE